jgi:hypothetical protein
MIMPTLCQLIQHTLVDPEGRKDRARHTMDNAKRDPNEFFNFIAI